MTDVGDLHRQTLQYTPTWTDLHRSDLLPPQYTAYPYRTDLHRTAVVSFHAREPDVSWRLSAPPGIFRLPLDTVSNPFQAGNIAPRPDNKAYEYFAKSILQYRWVTERRVVKLMSRE